MKRVDMRGNRHLLIRLLLQVFTGSLFTGRFERFESPRSTMIVSQVGRLGIIGEMVSSLLLSWDERGETIGTFGEGVADLFTS